MPVKPTFPSGKCIDYSSWIESSIIPLGLLLCLLIGITSIPTRLLMAFGNYTLLGCAWIMIGLAILGTLAVYMPLRILSIPDAKLGLTGTLLNNLTISSLTFVFIFEAIPFGHMHPTTWNRFMPATGHWYYEGLSLATLVLASFAWWKNIYNEKRLDLKELERMLSCPTVDRMQYEKEYHAATASTFNRRFLRDEQYACEVAWFHAENRVVPAQPTAPAPVLPAVPTQFDPFEL